LILDILCVTYFLTSITMRDPQYVSDTLNDVSADQLTSATCEFYV